jgi:uncharacterized protein YcbX
MKISGIYTYPIKSCGGNELDAVTVGPRGILNDRLLMLVTPEGDFLTQRDAPRMALIHPRWQMDTLEISAPGMPSHTIEPTDRGPRQQVTIWRDTCEAVDQGDAAAGWFSTYLKTPCRLVRLADDFTRQVDQRYTTRSGDQTGFADGFPFLIISQASLDDLNGRLTTPLPMNRFRPNLVVAGSVPFAEDTWKVIRVGDILFDVVKPCARCAITTTDQTTAECGKEPLHTLATYRTVNGKVMFGQNAIHHSGGQLHLGDSVEILDIR